MFWSNSPNFPCCSLRLVVFLFAHVHLTIPFVPFVCFYFVNKLITPQTNKHLLGSHYVTVRCIATVYNVTVYNATIYNVAVFHVTVYNVTAYNVTVYNVTVCNVTVYNVVVLQCN